MTERNYPEGGDAVILKTVSDYQKEIERVKAASRATHSEYLKRDYAKYVKRLQKEMRKVMYAK